MCESDSDGVDGDIFSDGDGGVDEDNDMDVDVDMDVDMKFVMYVSNLWLPH